MAIDAIRTHPSALPPDAEMQHAHVHAPYAAPAATVSQLAEAQSPTSQHNEKEELCDHVHYSNRAPWLRAVVLGASDGLVSVSSLMLGVGAGSAERRIMILSGVAGLVAGALSMACGEWVSVSSQRDSEKADIEKERKEQAKGPEAQARELDELTEIYEKRGLSYELARRVAEELTAKDVIRAHARDELGIDMDELANPLQAAVASMIAFSIGAGLPLLAGAFITARVWRMVSVAVVTTVGLAVFGALGAILGGAWWFRGALRVVVGGLIAMGITFGFGALFNIQSA